jgi:hypothetical protein
LKETLDSIKSAKQKKRIQTLLQGPRGLADPPLGNQVGRRFGKPPKEIAC